MVLHRLIAVLVLAAAGCGGGNMSTNADLPPAIEDTTLGVGDVFDVRVYGEEHLSTSYRVAQDGTIDFPFVGRYAVAGAEPPAVADGLAERLRDGGYLRNPQVSVFVREVRSKRVSVVGAVARPGTLELTSGMTVVHAISQAGGFTSIASTNQVIVSRRVGGELRRFRVPVEDVQEGAVDDVALQAGDIVYVPERVF